MVQNYSETEVTEQEFSELINNSHRLVVVDFFAEWCMPCLMISPIIEDLAKGIEEVKFVKINIDDNPKLASKYSVSKIPCLVIFKNGEEVSKIIGAQTQESIEEKIRGHLH